MIFQISEQSDKEYFIPNKFSSPLQLITSDNSWKHQIDQKQQNEGIIQEIKACNLKISSRAQSLGAKKQRRINNESMKNENKQNFNFSNLRMEKYFFDQNCMSEEQEVTIKQQAKLEIFRQLRLFKFFTAWKSLRKSAYEQQIDEEQKKVKDEIKVKYQFFNEWKRTAVGQKRAGLFYKNKIYRLFFMECTSMLHLRLKTIYCEQVLKKIRLPKIIKAMKENLQNLRVLTKKLAIRRFSGKVKRFHQQKNFEYSMNTLAELHRSLWVKKKAWGYFSSKRKNLRLKR